MALMDTQKASTANQGEMVQDRAGNMIPKRKLVNDTTHVYNPETANYEPESTSDNIRNSIVSAGSSLWNKIKGD